MKASSKEVAINKESVLRKAKSSASGKRNTIFNPPYNSETSLHALI
jgi:hypothetical protein